MEDTRARLIRQCVATGSSEKLAKEHLSRVRALEQWDIFQRYVGPFKPGMKILEIGSGYGTFLYEAALCGLEGFGIDPAGYKMKYARELLADIDRPPRLFSGYAENLPFQDDTFDLIYSTNVLEHVSDPDKVIHEALRVLKPGGKMQFVIPNYGSWWEGHYGILWIPNIPRSLAKIWVRLWGRNTDILQSLQLVNYHSTRNSLRNYQGKLEILDWGTALWEYRLRSMDFSGWHTLSKLKRLVNLVHRLRLVSPLIWIGKKLHWESPLVLSTRKIE